MTGQNADNAAINEWHILNKTTIAMGRAKNPDEVLDLMVEGLSQLGFHVYAGNIDWPKQIFRVEHMALSPVVYDQYNEGAIEKLNDLMNQDLSFDLVATDWKTLLTGGVRFISPAVETLYKSNQPTVRKIAELLEKIGRTDLRSVVSLLSIQDKPEYIVLVTAPTVTADDVPSVTAFINVASAIMRNHFLLRRADEQRRLAQTLQDVTTIVSSSLDLQTVLNMILNQLATVIPYDSSAILLESNNQLQLEAGAGFDQDEAVLNVAVPVDTNVLYQEMRRERKPILINDVRHDPRYTLWAGTSPIRSWIGVPILWKEQTIGQISVDSFTENAYTEQEVDVVFTFARHVANAINNARLFRQANQTANELRALLESAKDVASTFDTNQVIYEMAGRVKDLMHADMVAVYLQAQDDGALNLSLNLHDVGVSLNEEARQEVAQQAIDTGQGIIFNAEPLSDSALSDSVLPDSVLPDSVEDPDEQKAYMAAPFIVQDVAIGAVVMCRKAEANFKQADIDLLTRFTLQTGVAIENSRLYAQVERRLRREGLINQFARRLSSKLSLDELALDIMQTVKIMSGADESVLVLVDPADGESFLQYQLDSPRPDKPMLLSTLPALVDVTMNTQHIYLTDEFSMEGYAHPQWIEGKVRGAIAVPVAIGDDPRGVLGLFTRERPFTHSDEILNTLESIGRQAGVAIENALLFKQVNEYAQNLAEQVEERTAEIRAQKERTDAILAGAADAIIITDANGRIEYINPAFTKLTGYKLEEVIGQNPSLLKSGQTPLQVYQTLWQTVLSGRVWRGELKNKRQDGSLYDADLTIAPIFDQHKKTQSLVGIQRDISQLRELDRLKTEFLGTAAHELRSPLTTIRGYAELLLARGGFSPEEIQKFVGYIYEQSVHLTDLVSDLLDVSKIESGAAFSISPELLNPKSIFEEKVALWQSRTDEHTITLIEPESWPEIRVDPTRLDQALNNLLSNALKYSPDGGDITVRVKLGSANLRVSVIDHGIGMTLQEQQHIFEKFWRADASSTAIEGTGLGMVIVKYIIESHRGKIWVSSRRGQGTSINFSLPLDAGLATILIIEDEQSILEVQQRLLEMEGYQVCTAMTGPAGLESAQAQHPDLIILDLMLPDMDGEEVLKHLKASPSTNHIPVVVVSAKSGLAHIENTFSLGAVDFLTKPFDVEEYLGRIKIACTK